MYSYNEAVSVMSYFAIARFDCSSCHVVHPLSVDTETNDSANVCVLHCTQTIIKDIWEMKNEECCVFRTHMRNSTGWNGDVTACRKCVLSTGLWLPHVDGIYCPGWCAQGLVHAPQCSRCSQLSLLAIPWQDKALRANKRDFASCTFELCCGVVAFRLQNALTWA